MDEKKRIHEFGPGHLSQDALSNKPRPYAVSKNNAAYGWA